MKKFAILSVFIVAVYLIACESKEKKETTSTEQFASADLENHPGKNLMVTNCYSCHAAPKTVDHENRIAPPFKAIKKHYTKEYPEKEAFVNAIIDFHKNPTEEKALMKKAVEKFGLMPKFGYPEQDIKAIAEFMFEADMEKTYVVKQVADGEKTTAEKGLNYAMSTKRQLGKNLMNAIQSKGTSNAVEFCNIHAYPITDSLAEMYDLTIKRVTDKPRNPENKANELELGYIEHFKNVLAKGIEAEPVVEENGHSVNFYYPIITNAMCMQCHGDPASQIDEATQKQLATLYPADKATGYDIDEVRGMWSISWDKN